MNNTQNSYFDFKGKNILITGASRGLGRAMSEGFADVGANVALLSRKKDSCQEVADAIRRNGGTAHAYSCNMGHWQKLEGVVEEIYDDLGHIDVLINNAGTSPVAPSSLETTEELFDKIMDVNLKGPFRLMSLIGHRMREHGSGSIINISSTGAIRPRAEYAPYCAAKGGLNIITQALAFEFGPKVRINAIMVGPFWTDMSATWREELDKTIDSAAQRIGRGHELVSTAMYLASEHSSYTTGSIVEVSGGIR